MAWRVAGECLFVVVMYFFKACWWCTRNVSHFREQGWCVVDVRSRLRPVVQLKWRSGAGGGDASLDESFKA